MSGQAPDPYDDRAQVARDEATAEPSPALVRAAGPADDGALAPERSRVTTVVAAVALVLGLGAWGWFATEDARDGWWALGEHVAITPDDDGWVEVAPVRLRLVGAEADVRTGPGTAPPAGFSYLELTFEVTSEETEAYRSCEVEVLDEQGRLFLAGREVPGLGDDYVSELMCGTSDPEDDPVPSTQATLVLVPDDAVPVSVRVDSRDFPPASFVELPLP